MTNIDIVQQMYAAFGRGDIPAILDRMAADVVWEYGVNSTDIPWLRPRRGKEGVADFFACLSEFEIHKFQPQHLLGGDNIVVGLVDFEATVKATGKRIVEEDEVHIFYFNGAGQVTKFRHRVDTYQAWAAYQRELVATTSAS
jgi:hypothetical protein